jgi:hypothetical protein
VIDFNNSTCCIQDIDPNNHHKASATATEVTPNPSTSTPPITRPWSEVKLLHQPQLRAGMHVLALYNMRWDDADHGLSRREEWTTVYYVGSVKTAASVVSSSSASAKGSKKQQQQTSTSHQYPYFVYFESQRASETDLKQCMHQFVPLRIPLTELVEVPGRCFYYYYYVA